MNVRHALHSVFKQTAEYITGPLSKSQFAEKGVLTPEEFVLAGDYLVRACPTWAWEGGEEKKHKKYLPANKQYLVTRNVPCLKRAAAVESSANDEFALQGDEEGWVATHTDPDAAPAVAAEIPSIDDDNADEEIPDIGALDLEEDEAALPAARPYLKAEEPEDNIIKTRTYDLYITYDQYYQVPRFWLVGFDEQKMPLTPAQVLEDVSEEHARKTITVDPHPHQPVTAASIHPCRHAEVMKKLVGNLQENGKEFSVELYLLLFLKFISSVVPTIQYDYTMSVGA